MRRNLLLIASLLIISCSLAYGGPIVYLTEEITSSYTSNGTLISNVSRGHVDVGVPNTCDVLQYIRVNLTGNTSATNLVSNVTYHAVAASPNYSYEKTRLFHNTTVSDMELYYEILDGGNASPAFNATMAVSNHAGGPDLYSNDNIWDHYSGTYPTSVNIMNFTLNITNPSSWMNLVGVNVTLVFRKDTGPGAGDSVNITTAPTFSSGSGYSVDSDSDGFNESVYWTGTFTPGMVLQINFNGTMAEGINFANTTMDININGMNSNTYGARVEYFNDTAAITGLTIASRFARGPVLNGIDMSPSVSGWKVRSFFENIACDNVSPTLVYNVTEGRLYRVNGTTGTPNATADYSFTPTVDWDQITVGQRKYSDQWVDYNGSEKPYYTAFFDWNVLWNETNSYNFTSVLNTSVVFPTLHVNDICLAKTYTGVLPPNTENATVTLHDRLTYCGSAAIDIDRVQINSTIPHLLDNGTPDGLFRINSSSFTVVYRNSTGTYPINISSPTVNITWMDPTTTSDGYVYLNISDIPTTQLVQGNTIDMNLTLGDYIELSYGLLSNSTMEVGYNFTFTGNGTGWSPTPDKEYFPNLTIPVTPKRLTAFKQLIALDPNNPTLINVTIQIDVTDASVGGTGISGIKFSDYVPNGTDFTNSTPIYVQFYNMSSNAWETWTKTVEYNQTLLAWITLNDGLPAQAWEYTNATNSTGWVMHDNETLIFNYQMNVTDPRVYTLPAEIAAFDPDTGINLGTTVYAYITVTIPEDLIDPEIVEGDLTLAKFITVGRPAEWLKTFEVYNPNMGRLPATFETRLFPDTVNAYVVYTDEQGNERREDIELFKRDGDTYGSWSTTLLPFETRSYYVKVLTPAVVSVNREISVLEKLTDDTVKLRLDVDLKNLALEDYPQVRLYLPIRSDQVLTATDSLGNDLDFSGVTAAFILDDFESLEARSVTVDFQESYPIVIVTPDREEYLIDGNVSLDIRIINGGESVDNPYLETEVYSPYEDTIYSNIRSINGIAAVAMSDEQESFNIPVGAPTGMYLASVRFREDFNVISTGDASFRVIGGGSFSAIGSLIVLAACAGLVYFVFRKYKEVKQ